MARRAGGPAGRRRPDQQDRHHPLRLGQVRPAQDRRRHQEAGFMGTPSEGGTSELIIKVAASWPAIDPDEVQTQVVGLAPGVFGPGQVRAGSAATSSPSTPRWPCRSSSPTRCLLLALGRSSVESGGQVYIASKDQAGDTTKQTQLRYYLAAIKDAVQFVEEDAANGFTEPIKCLAKIYPTFRPSRTLRSARPRSPSTSSPGPRPATTRSPRPCLRSGRRSKGDVPARASSPRGSGPGGLVHQRLRPWLVTSRQPAGAGLGSPTPVGATPSGVPEAGKQDTGRTP